MRKVWKAVKDCKYSVGLYMREGIYGWEAQTDDENGLNMGVIDSGLLYRFDGDSISRESARKHWVKFARLNGIKKWIWDSKL